MSSPLAFQIAIIRLLLLHLSFSRLVHPLTDHWQKDAPSDRQGHKADGPQGLLLVLLSRTFRLFFFAGDKNEKTENWTAKPGSELDMPGETIDERLLARSLVVDSSGTHFAAATLLAGA